MCKFVARKHLQLCLLRSNQQHEQEVAVALQASITSQKQIFVKGLVLFLC